MSYVFPLNDEYRGFQITEQMYGFSRSGGTEFHDGVDFGTTWYSGRNLIAVGNGTVVATGVNLGWGIGAYIVVLIDGHQMMYQEYAMDGSNPITKNVGDTVTKGEVIGSLNASSTHLHFGILAEGKDWLTHGMPNAFTDNGTWLDPINFLTNGRCNGNSMEGGAYCFVDDGTVPVDPVDPVDPPEPTYDLSKYQKAIEELLTDIQKKISSTLYQGGAGYQNSHMVIIRQLNNSFVLKPGFNIVDLFKKIDPPKTGPTEPTEPIDPPEPSGELYKGEAITQANGRQISNVTINQMIKGFRSVGNNVGYPFLIAQMWLESNWGDPNISYVGDVDNNWSGISMPFSIPGKYNCQMSQGTPRPSNEGGYYVHFPDLDNYFIAYAFVLSLENGFYKVDGKTTIEEYTKGLFRIGGAAADYAASGYNHYLGQIQPTFNWIYNNNKAQMEELFSLSNI